MSWERKALRDNREHLHRAIATQFARDFENHVRQQRDVRQCQLTALGCSGGICAAGVASVEDLVVIMLPGSHLHCLFSRTLCSLGACIQGLPPAANPQPSTSQPGLPSPLHQSPITKHRSPALTATPHEQHRKTKAGTRFESRYTHLFTFTKGDVHV